MTTRVFPWASASEKEKSAVYAWAAQNLAQFAPEKYRTVWVAARYDGEGRLQRVTGVTGFTLTPDISLLRFTDQAAAASLIGRMHAYFADNGLRGGEVLVHLAAGETEDQRCPEWERWIEGQKARPGDRWVVEVR